MYFNLQFEVRGDAVIFVRSKKSVSAHVQWSQWNQMIPHASVPSAFLPHRTDEQVAAESLPTNTPPDVAVSCPEVPHNKDWRPFLTPRVFSRPSCVPNRKRSAAAVLPPSTGDSPPRRRQRPTQPTQVDSDSGADDVLPTSTGDSPPSRRQRPTQPTQVDSDSGTDDVLPASTGDSPPSRRRRPTQPTQVDSSGADNDDEIGAGS